MFKKLISVFMIVLMLIPFAACAGKKATNSKGAAADIIKKLGYKETDELTKADLAMLLTYAAGKEGEAQKCDVKDIKFSDIKSDSKYAGYIKIACENGFLDGETDTEFKPDNKVTEQELTKSLLLYSGMKKSQLGTYPDDYLATAENMGMLSGIEYDSEKTATVAVYSKMLESTQPLYEAMHKELKAPYIVNGAAQPIYDYDEVVRYCVYVETNHDTDLDGKLDLIKVLVQLPGEALNGLKVPIIYEARPYIAGMTSYILPEGNKTFDMSKMYDSPKSRVPEGSMTTAQAVANAKESDYYYQLPVDDYYYAQAFADAGYSFEEDYEQPYFYEDLDWYDYYLVRGFAVVECAGPGTYGSEGLCTSGSDLEIDAFKCVIDWLSGSATAYTDRTSNIEIKADWSNGNVGMTGRSYAGTTQFGLATTGAEGLKTIVPVAGMSNWYDYRHKQGIDRNGLFHTDCQWLSWHCSSAMFNKEFDDRLAEVFESYAQQLRADERAYNCNYCDVHAVRDYTLNYAGIKCPALIVQGLNDDNVTTRHMDLMYKSYKKAGADVKLLLHQGTHLTPTYPTHRTEMYVNGELYDNLLNKWFCHYLLGVNNGIEKMPEVTVQNNTDGSWNTYSSYETTGEFKMEASKLSDLDKITIEFNSQKEEEACWSTEGDNMYDVFASGESTACAMYTVDIPEDMTIMGDPIEVHIKASTTLAKNNQRLSAMLVDVSDTPFMTYEQEYIEEYGDMYIRETLLKEKGAWMGGGLENYDLVEFKQIETNRFVIAWGTMDMANPESGYEPSSVKDDTIPTPGKFVDYTLYLDPNVYTVKAGHKLVLVIYTNEYAERNTPNRTVVVDNSATYAVIPTV